MSKIISLKINNSKKAAIKTGTWSNTGADFYDKLMNAFYCEGNVPTGKELEKKIKEGKYLQWFDFLKEAYLVAPVDKIKNSPYGRTPFSKSECKYPHHVIRNGELVVSIPGLKAAYMRACQMNILKGSVKDHLEKHIKELGIQASFNNGKLSWNECTDLQIESNFNDIYSCILETTGIDLFDDYDEFNEASHGKLKYDFREVYDYDTGHSLKIIYSLDNINITDIGGHYLNDTYKNDQSAHKKETIDDIQKNIRKKGNSDHQSYGQKVLAIVDRVTNKKLNSARTFGPYSPIIKDSKVNVNFTDLAIPKDVMDKIHKECELKGKKYINDNIFKISIGDIDTNPTFKSTKWYRDNIGFLYKGNKIVPTSKESKKDIFQALKDKEDGLEAYNNNNTMRTAGEHYKYGRGFKMDDIDPDHGLTLDEIPRWKHPSKKELERVRRINESLEWIDNFVNNDLFQENVMKEESFKKVKTPEELLKWMDCINYGWIDSNGNVNGTGDNDENDFYKEYRLQSPNKLLKSKVGVCWDQTEFERNWFDSRYIPYAIFYIEINNGRECPSHTFLIYETKNGYNWFEHSWYDMKGIHKYDTIKECLSDIIDKHRKFNNDKKSPLIITHLSNKPKYDIGCKEFMDYAHSQSNVDLNDLSNEIFNESVLSLEFLNELSKDIKSEDDEKQIIMNNETIRLGGKIPTSGDLKQYRISDEELEEVRNRDILDEYIESFNMNEDKKKKDFVPIYGIIKQYSLSKFRNDGTIKDDGELSSVRFHKIIKALTKGDNYSHALVSFDDSLTNMYSYEDEGFVVDNIMTKDSWMGTSSIYICVMFVSKEDKKRMEKYVKNLKDHANESRYASANLLKAYVGKPYKVDKRFVCSSFTGYIMSCANPKNLHRDYSRLRPEDITILPRAFYVMNVKDREDFINHKNDIKKKVDAIYDEYKDEIDDYNNHLPKLMLQDRVDKLKTIDKIFDWIIDRL